MRTVYKGLALFALLGTVAAVVAYASFKNEIHTALGQPPATVEQKGQRRGGGGGEQAPQPVLVGTASLDDVPIVLEGVGTAKALATVVVRAQVEGKILRYHFKEGETVRKGDLLAEIDPTPYQAALDQVIARRQLTETQLQNARRDLERFGKVSAGVIAQKTIDTQQAQVAQLEAQIKADTAAIESAQTTLAYTRVLAPISGRTGLRQMDEGNIARGSDQSGLVTITQVEPIAVIFTLPQQQLQMVNRALGAGPVPAEAMDGENRVLLDRGVVQVIDNQVDQSTGTIKLKAEFPNTERRLWPGQFVNVRLVPETLKQVVTVPTPAIQRGPQGPFVFTTADGEKVAMRAVTVGLQTDTVSVIRSGVRPGERVVTSGFTRLQDGARIRIADPAAPSSAAPTRPADQPGADESGKGRRRGKGDGTGRNRPAPVEPIAGSSAPTADAGAGERVPAETVPTKTASPGRPAPTSTPQ